MLKHFNIRNIFVVSLCLAALPLLAAEGAAGAPQQQMMEKTIIGLAIAAIIAALVAIGWVMNVLLTTQRMRLLEEHGIEGLQKAGIKVRTEPLWKQWYKRITQTVPVAQEKSILMDHDYDGIRELDNRLPPWWVATFYVSIAFGIFYIGYTHFSDYGQTTEEWYTMEMEEAESAVAAYLATQADQVDETNIEVLVDENQIALGESIFQTNCAVCHGAAGEGGTGPNLTDNYWLHGGGIKNVFKTIKYGVPEKGMIAWKAQMRPSDMQKLASFILTLEGTNPPNAKEPQGEIWQEEIQEENIDDPEEGMEGSIGMN